MLFKAVQILLCDPFEKSYKKLQNILFSILLTSKKNSKLDFCQFMKPT